MAALEAAGYTQIAVQVVEGTRAPSGTGAGIGLGPGEARRLERRGLVSQTVQSYGDLDSQPLRYSPSGGSRRPDDRERRRAARAAPPAAPLDGRGEEDLAEELGVDGAAAAEGEEEAARREGQRARRFRSL